MVLSSPPSPRCFSLANVAAPIVVAVVTAAVFARLIGCQFTVWDDSSTISTNPKLNPPTWEAVGFYWTTIGRETPGQLFTPVTYTVWAAVASVAGVPADADGIRLDPALFHGANVALHATTAVLVYMLLWRLFDHRWPAAAGALLFALHPVQVEPVGWASGTKDVLCGLFAVAALLAYVRAAQVAGRGRGAARARYALATSLFLLAMLSKPTALVVPLMAAVIDALVLGRPWRTVVRWLWPWAVLMVPCGMWTRAAQPAPWASPVPVWTRPLVATDAVAFYLAMLAWPLHLCVDYGRRPTAVVGSGAVYWTWLLPAALVALLAWRRSKPAIAAAALFALPLLPVSGLVPFDFQFYSTVADHYLYLPMLGAAVLATWALSRFPRRAAVTGAVALLSSLAVRSALQTATWRDTATLFAHAGRVNPLSFVACDMQGYVEAQRGRRIRGSRHAVPPSDPRYAEWRAHLERSQAWYRQSLARFDGYVPSLVNLAINAGQLGQHDQQRAALRRVAELQPTLPTAMRADPLNLGQWMIDAGDPAAAAAYLDRVLQSDPDDMRLILLRSRALAAIPR